MERNAWLFYPFKKESVKFAVIELLSVDFPLSIKQIHHSIKQQFNIKVSYQGVHKTIKRLLKDGCLSSFDQKYALNDDWIKQLKTVVEQLESKYSEMTISVLASEVSGLKVIVAKDEKIKEIIQEKRLKSYLKELASIYRQEFSEHNILKSNEETVVEYLLTVQKKHELLVFFENNKVIGGTVLELKDENPKEQYKIWKLKHFALSKDIKEKIEAAIIEEAIDRLKQKSKTFKIQLNLAENEERYIELFKKYGFKKEATIKNRYRIGEKMFIYSREF